MYQLVFLTAEGRDARSANIADYNAFVTSQAALSATLPAGATWRAVGSTRTVWARENAPNPQGIPAYNTQGVKVADGGELYTKFPLVPIASDQYGSSVGQAMVWTGSLPDGSVLPDPGHALGEANPGFGIDCSGGGWLTLSVASAVNPLRLYALSSPITVPVPEPSTAALLVTTAVILAARAAGRAWRISAWQHKGTGAYTG
jgi:hypothetical protein